MKYLLLALLLLQSSPIVEDKNPTLDIDDGISISLLVTLGTLANKECNNLDTTKVFNTQRDRVQSRIETKYPGYTLNWNTLLLVKK